MRYTDKELEDAIDRLASSTRSPKGKYSAAESYKLLKKRLPGRSFGIIRRVASVAAAIAVLGVLSFSAYNYYTRPVNMITVSTLAETKEIKLPDGSKVKLNRHSTISYPKKFKSENRDITLSGGAYFEVTKDKSHPFIVQTESINIQVLGTQFNVEAYEKDDIVKTILVEGSVAVSNKPETERLILQPLQSAVYNKEEDTLIMQPVQNIQDEMAWQEGEFRFTNLTMEQIARILSNSFHASIRIDDANLKTYRMTGRFADNESLDTILQLMKTVGGFDYVRSDSIIYLKAKR